MKTPIEFAGTVVHGKGMGRRIGFPTANIALRAMPAVAYGVYAAEVEVDGQRYPAIVNVGKHPTLPEGPPTVEAHLIGETMDLYGKRVQVRLQRYMRAERRFESLEALRGQIRQDIDEALR